MEIWTATLTKTVSSASEHLEELLKRLATRSDDYEKVSINVQALSEEKRATFCDEVINYFANGVPSFEKMTPNVVFDFDKPHPRWPSCSSSLKMPHSKGEISSISDRKFLKWNLRNQCSGEGFTLSISSNALQSEVHTMCIQVVADRGGAKTSLEPPKSSGICEAVDAEQPHLRPSTTVAKQFPVSTLSSRRHSTSTTTTSEIGDLRTGLLGRALIQHLPWRKRVQVEGVCRRWQREALTHGWADVEGLGVGDLWKLYPREGGRSSINVPLLLPAVISRAGPHLTTLALTVFGEDLNEAMLRAMLAECPQVRHLEMGLRQLNQLPNFLRELLCVDGEASAASFKLKSLGLRTTSLVDAIAEEMQGAAMFVQALNPHSLPQLEHLRMSSEGLFVRRLPPALRFPPHCQLANLRRLELDNCQDIFDAQSLGQLPSLCPALRSFTLGQFTAWDLSFLGHFSRLEHLEITLLKENLPSFDTALLHLGGTLKALEVWGRLGNRQVKDSSYTLITPVIVSRLPKLEHLDLRVETWGEKEEDEKVDRLLGSLASLGALRSLSLYWSCADWSWLVGISHRLEYLRLGGKQLVPLTTIYDIVSNGKSLRCLDLAHDWNAASLAGLAEAAAAAAVSSEGDGRGEEGASKSVALPILKITSNVFKSPSSDESEPVENVLVKGCSRLRFVQYSKMPSSHVLAKYRDGCLSEPSQ